MKRSIRIQNEQKFKKSTWILFISVHRLLALSIADPVSMMNSNIFWYEVRIYNFVDPWRKTEELDG